jgi:hypothetical protein
MCMRAATTARGAGAGGRGRLRHVGRRVHHARHSSGGHRDGTPVSSPHHSDAKRGRDGGRPALEITHALFAAVRGPRSRAVQGAPGAPPLAGGSSQRRCAARGRSATGLRASCHHARGAAAALAAPGWPVGLRVRAPSLRAPRTRAPTRWRTPRKTPGRALRRPGSCGGGALWLSSLIGKECCNCRLTHWRKGQCR